MDISANNLATSYKTIPLVGNKFQKHKPISSDKDIMLVHEDSNKNDPNAIAVYSKRNVNNKFELVKLGYIPKTHNEFIKNNLNNIIVQGIIRSADKNTDGSYYYYLLLNE